MRTISLPFTAGETKTLSIPGRMLRVLAGTAGTLDIDFFLGGRTVGEKASGVDAGYFGIPAEGFDRVDITSSSAQTVKLALGRGGFPPGIAAGKTPPASSARPAPPADRPAPAYLPTHPAPGKTSP